MSHLEISHIAFVGMFAKFQKMTIYFTMSVCPSFCLHGTTWLPLDIFSWNFIFEFFSKILSRKCFIKVDQEYLAQFLLEWKMFQKEVVEKIKTHFIFNYFFFLNCAIYEIMWKNVQPGRPQVTIWHMCLACWIPNVTNTHSDYVILSAVLLQQWLHEHASVLDDMYIACLVVSSVSVSSSTTCLHMQVFQQLMVFFFFSSSSSSYSFLLLHLSSSYHHHYFLFLYVKTCGWFISF